MRISLHVYRIMQVRKPSCLGWKLHLTISLSESFLNHRVVDFHQFDRFIPICSVISRQSSKQASILIEELPPTLFIEFPALYDIIFEGS